MRARWSKVLAGALAAAILLGGAVPALAQEAEGGSSRPWHYWIAPFLLGGAILLVAAVAVGYYVRVMGGRRRR